MDTQGLITSIVGSTVRHALTGVGAYLVGHNWITDADWGMAVTGIVMIIAGWIWSLVQKWRNPPAPTV